ncbi:vitamin K epoxide reductase family protein [Euryhalocaulis caribicus]|uniref:vitamin K epoxide reductase family protein n=1 Tax=Euryhalocaulis caribicus TaxID=1161401 RepID=UPI00039B15B7|nr:vitamin K epoxide reductase family protein [Euryhalocaulis caribicus]
MSEQDRKPVVLITGAAGDIGSAVGEALEDDYRVVGLDLVCGQARGRCIESDIGDFESVRAALEKIRKEFGGKIAAFIHLAAYFDFTGEDNPLYDKVNVQGSRNLMRALQDFEVERVLYSGTMLVHAATDPGKRIDEETPLDPQWTYPVSKAETEDAIRETRGDIPVTFFHLAGLYDEKTAVPTLSHQIARIYERDLKSHVFSGDRSAGQSFIHKDDLIDLFRRGVDRRGDMPEECIILAGEPEGVAYQALQDEIGCLIHGQDEWETLSIPQTAAKAGAWAQEKSEPVIPDAIDQGEKPFIRPFMIDMADDHYALDISKAERLLGWRPQHDIRDELPAMIDALKADPAGWYKANGIQTPDWLDAMDEQAEDAEAPRRRYHERRKAEHERFRWAHLLNAALGAWLITSPPTLGYESAALAWSDAAAGAVVMIFSLLATSQRFEIARWVTAAAGFWLLWAPLIFWAPTAQAYLNETLVGALIIGLSICTRPVPGVSPAAAETGPDIPPGWEFCPSTWMQRLPIILLALVGLMISRHLTAYQLGHIEEIWEPFFAGAAADPKNGSEEITTSSVSEAWPVPDAGVGALVYMLEIITGIMGTNRRWRTMPWLVMAFGFMIVPLGVVSITFIIIQPIVIGTWCTLCLIGAAAMLIQIPYSLDELIATTQFLVRRVRKGRPLLRIFFVGDTDDGDAQETDNFDRGPVTLMKDMWSGGVGLPWNLVLSLLIGLWLMFTRLTLGAEGMMANADHLIGSLVITASIIALAESARPVRFMNAGLGVALILTPLILGVPSVQTIAGIVAGLVLIALSFRRGAVTRTYGGLDRFLV